MEFLTTCSANALISGLALNIFTDQRDTNRDAEPVGFPIVSTSTGMTGSPFALSRDLSFAFLFLIGIAAIFVSPAQAQLGFHKGAASPSATSAATSDGLPTRVVYNDQKYLVTSGPGGMTYSVTLEGSPSPIGMVIKAPHAPVKYQAFDNTLDTAETVKAVYAAFLNPTVSSGTTTSPDSVTVTSFDAAKKEATVQTSTGQVHFTNSLNDFDLMVGSNPVHGHFSDGSTAGQKAGHVLKSLGRSVSTFGMDSKQMYAGSVVEITMNHGPKSAFGEDGKAKDMGTSGGANAAGIKYTFQPVAGIVASAAAKAAEALGMDKPKYVVILNALAGVNSVDN